MSLEEAVELAYEHKINYLEASALTGQNVKRAFKDLVKEIRNQKKEALMLSGYEVATKKKEKKEKKKQDDVENALSIVKDPKRRQELCNSVPKMKIVPLKKKLELVIITGPPANESEQSYRDIVSAKSISTYPYKNLETKEREGDPICDQYYITQYENRTIFAIADGCNWGKQLKSFFF